MKTSEFPYLKFPFDSFNVAQSKVIPLTMKESNLIVSFPPGAGKTVIAEACFAATLKTTSKKVAYVCPLKALANQKRDDWSETFRGFGICVVSGDSGNHISDVGENRIVIFTSESFDSALKKNDKFFQELGCVCFDEVHLIGDESRGGAYEASVMGITKINPDCRLILLSGTLNNAKQIGKWIKLLTQKETHLCVSDWRPNEFSVEYHYVKKYEEIKKLIELLKTYKNSKTIVFVHSKIVGKRICEELKKEKIRHVYHNATLTETKRKRVEELFIDKYSSIDVIVSTSTLAAGVNLA